MMAFLWSSLCFDPNISLAQGSGKRYVSDNGDGRDSEKPETEQLPRVDSDRSREIEGGERWANTLPLFMSAVSRILVLRMLAFQQFSPQKRRVWPRGSTG